MVDVSGNFDSMIEMRKKRYGLPYSLVWFADSPMLEKALAPVIYMQCLRQGPVAGFFHYSFSTLLLDLSVDADSLLKGMSRSTSYQIKRAQREAFEVLELGSTDEFVAFYDGATGDIGRPALTGGEFASWGKELFAFVVKSGGEPVAMHTYLVDHAISRVRLLHSVSNFRQLADLTERNMIGRANRLLHFEAMLRFKDEGIMTYDMGGFAMHSTDRKVRAIARFKNGFGGRTVREDRYVSPVMRLLQLARRPLMGH